MQVTLAKGGTGDSARPEGANEMRLATTGLQESSRGPSRQGYFGRERPSQGVRRKCKLCRTPAPRFGHRKGGGAPVHLRTSRIDTVDPGIRTQLIERKRDRGKRLCESSGPPFCESTPHVRFTLLDRHETLLTHARKEIPNKRVARRVRQPWIMIWTERSSATGCNSNARFSSTVTPP